MAYYGAQADYDLAKKANPNADLRLYTPGMAIGENDMALGGSAVIPDSALANPNNRLWGNDRNATQAAFTNYDTNVRPLKDMQTSLQGQLKAQTDLYNQQAADQAAKIRQAIASQTQQGEATKTDYTNQMNTAIGTLNTERAKIPGQTTTLNNTASSSGMVNAQHIRNALSQMGLLQSGESGSQQLLNDTNTSNQVNANNLQGQDLNAQYGNKVATAQTDLASKVKAINDAISLAQAQGDENSLAVLKDAQAKIASAGAQSAVDYNNWAYKTGQDATQNRMTQQQIDAKAIQAAIDNTYNQSQADLKARQWQDSFTADNAYKNATLASDNSYKQGELGVARQNANTNSSKVNQDNSSLKMNDMIQRLNSLYTVKDSSNGTITVNPDTKPQLRAAIIGQGVSDAETDRMLLYYGLPVNK